MLTKTSKRKHSEIDTKLESNSSTDKLDCPENGLSALVQDEYEDDSSDEEEIRNTRGNVPLDWYDDQDNIGRDVDGKEILRPESKDAIDKLLQRLSDPHFYRSVLDKQSGKEVKVTDEVLSSVKRILTHVVADKEFDYYQKFEDLYSHEVMDMPLSGRPDTKSSFLPSKHEHRIIKKIVIAIQKGNYKKKTAKPKVRPLFDIWDKEDMQTKLLKPRKRKIVPTPKRDLPSISESYHPPPEYLIRRLCATGKGSLKSFSLSAKLSAKEKSIRRIPQYSKYVEEHAQRLDDVYFGTRKKTTEWEDLSSKDLLPVLPDLKDMRPYPTMEEMKFEGHRSVIRSISIHRNGKLLASGSDDCTIRVWEIETGRCLKIMYMEEPIKCVSWNPNPDVLILGACYKNSVVMINPESYIVDALVVKKTNAVFRKPVDQGDYEQLEHVSKLVKWKKPTASEYSNGIRVHLKFSQGTNKIVWYGDGDYFVTISPSHPMTRVLIHQLSRLRSTNPWRKLNGYVQTGVFHHSRPFLYLATKKFVRIYNLRKGKLKRKVKLPKCIDWISSITTHPKESDFAVSCFKKMVVWIDHKSTRRPHKLFIHSQAVRAIQTHNKYPLMATCSDDGKIIITHVTINNDFISDPTIIPLKTLHGHMKYDDMYALDLQWHPHEPFLFTAGADATIRMWV